ncbi:DUF2927 domain-containing protein, partial [Rhodopseudomonas palustris]|nr:DUF2927 domain-containing protein [Rhodopseudomonas palustris]
MQCGFRPRPSRRALAATFAAALAVLSAAPADAADNTDVSANQRAEKKDFTDSEIFDGFFKTAFGAEYHLAGRVDRIRKFDGPVRIHAEGETRP